MTLQFTYSATALTPEQIQDVEQRIGRQFPDEYRRFLLQRNGGHPEPCEFRFKHPQGDWDWGIIAYFLSLSGEYETLFEYLTSYGDRVPKETLPIARDPGGNPILLTTSGRNKGKVYFWMRENEPEDEEEINSFDHLGFIANSLDEFLGSLTTRG